MEINGIFTHVPRSLYSVVYDHKLGPEFSRLFRLWNNAEYLEDFFLSHFEDLRGYWGNISVEEAVTRTRLEAKHLEKKIIRVAESGLNQNSVNLSGLFKPLSNAPTFIDTYEKNKLKGMHYKSWLRVYAVRLGVNRFIVSGGAIKLTQNMNTREHLLIELEKLGMLCKFLRDDESDRFETFELL